MYKAITALIMAAIVIAVIAGIGGSATKRQADIARSEVNVNISGSGVEWSGIKEGIGAAYMGITVLVGATTIFIVAASHHTKVEKQNMKKFHDMVDGKGM